MPQDEFEPVARRYEEATEVDLARRHAEIAVNHFCDHNVPQGSTDVLVSHVHQSRARSILGELTPMHAAWARLES